MRIAESSADVTAAPSLRGIVAAAITPVTETGAVDTQRLADHVRRLLEDGCDMVSLFGSTGEGPSFSLREKLAALAAVVAAGVEPVRLIPAVIADSVDEARAMLGWVAGSGCRAALILPPHFFTATEDGVFAFLDAALGSSGPDFLLYHYPAMSGFGFSHALIERLFARFGRRLVGVKDSTGDLAHTLGLIRRFPDLAVFTGCDTDLAAIDAHGGAGIVGGAVNLTAALLRRRLGAPEAEHGALDDQIAALFAVIVAAGGPAPLRTLLAERYGDAAWLRTPPPLTTQSAAEREALIAAFRAAGYRFGRADAA